MRVHRARDAANSGFECEWFYTGKRLLAFLLFSIAIREVQQSMVLL